MENEYLFIITILIMLDTHFRVGRLQPLCSFDAFAEPTTNTHSPGKESPEPPYTQNPPPRVTPIRVILRNYLCLWSTQQKHPFLDLKPRITSTPWVTYSTMVCGLTPTYTQWRMAVWTAISCDIRHVAVFFANCLLNAIVPRPSQPTIPPESVNEDRLPRRR